MDLKKLEKQWDFQLSEAQKAFVEAYALTKSTAIAANMAGISKMTATALVTRPEVLVGLRIAEKKIRAAAQVTPEEVINDLRLIRDMALGRIPIPKTRWGKDDPEPLTAFVTEVDFGAANKAVENIGRIAGMFTDKKEITMTTTDAQLVEKLESILGVSLADAVDAEFTDMSANTVDGPFDRKPDYLSIECSNSEFVLEELFEDLAEKEIGALAVKAGERAHRKSLNRAVAGDARHENSEQAKQRDAEWGLDAL